MKTVFTKTVTVIAALLLSLVMLELSLKLYNPYPSRVRSGKIVLPVNEKYVFDNDRIAKIDKRITHTKNSLGFRGSEPPKNFSSYLSIVTVGGSTTECYYLSDDETWQHHLEDGLKGSYRVWVNNAGLDGFSTFGIKSLLQDYLFNLKPKMVVFMAGANDIGLSSLSQMDSSKVEHQAGGVRNILKGSNLYGLVTNTLRSLKSNKVNVGHGNLQFAGAKQLKLDQGYCESVVAEHRAKYAAGYRERLLGLLESCRSQQIVPVLVTQPSAVGRGIDPATGADLEQIKVADNQNGRLNWDVLEVYNEVTREVAKDQGVLLIDLARELPKRSEFFYDKWHFSVAGAKEAARLLLARLKPELEPAFRQYRLQ